MSTPDTYPSAAAPAAASSSPTPAAPAEGTRVENGVASSKVRSSPGGLLPREIADSIVAAFAGLEFGSIEITVHNSRVVQIERHERIRFAQPATHPPRAS